MNLWGSMVLGIVAGVALAALAVFVVFRSAVSTPEQAVRLLGVLVRGFADKAPPDLGLFVEIEGRRGTLLLIDIARAIESSCLHSHDEPLRPEVSGRVFPLRAAPDSMAPLSKD